MDFDTDDATPITVREMIAQSGGPFWFIVKAIFGTAFTFGLLWLLPIVFVAAGMQP